MAIVLDECTTEGQRSVVRFLWAKGLNDIHKETFRVHGGKCLPRKAVHNWVEKFSQGRLKVADGARPDRPVEIAIEQLGSGWKSLFELTGGKRQTVQQLH
jgi:hypothetical protein